MDRTCPTCQGSGQLPLHTCKNPRCPLPGGRFVERDSPRAKTDRRVGAPDYCSSRCAAVVAQRAYMDRKRERGSKSA